MWMMLLHLHVNQKSGYDDMMKKIFTVFNLPLLVVFSHECCLSVPMDIEQRKCCV